MICRRLHDYLHVHFGDVDSKEYPSDLVAAYKYDDWSSLLGVDADRDQALLHAAECSDCRDDIFTYLAVRDKLDYSEYPCVHLAYHATIERWRCIGNRDREYTVLLHGKQTEGIVIGFCPWCGVPVPANLNEREEAEKLGLKLWQQKQMKT